MAPAAKTQSVKFGDGNFNCGNITGSFNSTTIFRSDEDTQILRWLSPLEPGNRHDGVRTNRFEGVGNWLLETSEFRGWRRGGEDGADKAILFCSGNPGVGKTYLSSLVIDKLCDQAMGNDIAVAWVYCDYLVQQEQTVINIMGAILKRLVGRREIPKDIREAFEEGRRPLLPDLVRMLRIAIASLPQVFICIDGLDECLPRNLPELLESLRDIVRESSNTRIFLTGRPHVTETIQRYFTKAVMIIISPNQNDIRNYVETRLDRDDQPEAMNKDLRAEIVKMILDKMSDMFLLASLNIEAILDGVTIGQRRSILQEMARGNGLSDAYTATITRLKAQKGNRQGLGLQALMWVLCSGRPLRAEELCHALGIGIGSAELDPENIPALRTILASCLGLLTVEAPSSTVRLVHFTLQEHLSSDPTLSHSSHSKIAEVCMTYLNFGSVRDLPLTLNSAPSTMPLLEYASFYWAEHAKRGMTETIKILGLRLLEGGGIYGEHISARLLELNPDRGRVGVLLSGIVEVITTILQAREADVPTADSMESRALYTAILGGQEAVVRRLLDQEGVNPNDQISKEGWTPLLFATILGREGVVKILLEREGVNADQPDTKHGRTPLGFAAEGEHEGIVKLLLAREDVNPNQPDTNCGRTSLSWAAARGDEGVVKVLLEREDVNPDPPDTIYGRTPLSWAALNGNEGVVKMFLERDDVNPERPDNENGQTPLSLAAMNGCEGVVKMLLEHNANPDLPDTKYGRTPLTWAVLRGAEGVVKVLLERGDVNPDQPDTEYGRTPLSWAAVCGNEGIVKMLLKRGGVNPDRPDNEYGQTPLSLAAIWGHEVIVKALLEQDVNPDLPDTKYGRTPLSWAAVNGHEGVVKMLLARDDVNPNQPDTEYGLTPFSWAAQNGHERVVMMFLEQGMSALLDIKNQSQLSLAPPKGPRDDSRILLEQADPNSNKASHGDHTSFPLPARPGDEPVVEVQSKSSDPNTDFSDFNSQSQPPLAAHGEQAGLLGCQDSISESAEIRPQPNSPGGPDFLSDPETSSTAEGKPRPTPTTPNRSSCLSSTCVLFLLFFFVFSLLSFAPFILR